MVCGRQRDEALSHTVWLPMTEYALAGNIWSAPIQRDYIAWPRDKPESEVIDSLSSGDMVIPKFAAHAVTGGDEGRDEFLRFSEDAGLDGEATLAEYDETIRDGQAALPFLMRVRGRLEDLVALDKSWARVRVELLEPSHPLETKEWLRLRAIPEEIAIQFKGMAGKGRHLQEVDSGTADAVLFVASDPDRGTALRQFSVVQAADDREALEVLQGAGRSREDGDLALVVNDESVPGLFAFREGTSGLHYEGGRVRYSPAEIRAIFEEAALREAKNFSAPFALKTADHILNLLQGPDQLLEVDDLRGFYDYFQLLQRRVNRALEIRKMPLPQGAGPPAPQPETDDPDAEEGEVEIEEIEAEALEGLDIESVRTELPEGFALSDLVLAEAVTALRAGKHLLLSGPPGTGKSTLAEALCRAVVKQHFRVATATADWTTFDTIGGYMPSENGKLHFEPGIVLRCLRSGGQWLVIDEINRADIDKAFGPLFSVLAGTGEERPHSNIELPFQQDKKGVHIEWAESLTAATGEFVVTPQWRLLGTLNSSDKASLFQLSFAFLRRFAMVEVPLPDADAYKAWFIAALTDVEDPLRDQIATAAINLAFVKERELGPAILGDIARFISKALLETSAGESTFDARTAFLSAVRLFAVSQYEGARPVRVAEAEKAITEVWTEPPEPQWTALRDALKEVSLA